MSEVTMSEEKKITVEHIRDAIRIAKKGGTIEHPYSQSSWGSNRCGTPCCIWGHACILAGLPVRSPFPTEDIPYGVRLVIYSFNAHLAFTLAEVVLEAETLEDCLRNLAADGWTPFNIATAVCTSHRNMNGTKASHWTLIDFLASRWSDPVAVQAMNFALNHWTEEGKDGELDVAEYATELHEGLMECFNHWAVGRFVDAAEARWDREDVLAKFDLDDPCEGEGEVDDEGDE